MCFVLYIGTSVPLNAIDYDETTTAFHVLPNQLPDSANAKLGLPYTGYAGSSYGCGCAFRHAMLDQNEHVQVTPFDDEAVAIEQLNQEALFNYVTALLARNAQVRVFLCLDGDENEPIRFVDAISVAVLTEPDFHFRERGLYTIRA